MSSDTQLKTAEEIKEIIAREKTYPDWETCINDQPSWMVEPLMDEVVKRFAEQCVLEMATRVKELEPTKLTIKHGFDYSAIDEKEVDAIASDLISEIKTEGTTKEKGK